MRRLTSNIKHRTSNFARGRSQSYPSVRRRNHSSPHPGASVAARRSLSRLAVVCANRAWNYRSLLGSFSRTSRIHWRRRLVGIDWNLAKPAEALQICTANCGAASDRASDGRIARADPIFSRARISREQINATGSSRFSTERNTRSTTSTPKCARGFSLYCSQHPRVPR